MKIYHGFEEITVPPKGAVVTIGNFDGVHIGHQQVIGLAVERARKAGGTSVVVTFSPHTRAFFSREKALPMITSLNQRIELIGRIGVDILVVQPFNSEFAEITHEDFVVKLLLNKLAVERLIVSSKFRFGKGAGGNVEMLRKMAGEHGFKVEEIDDVRYRYTFVSSSFIRQAIAKGEMELVMGLLGRPYRISGSVYPDTHRGTELLSFPTSNVSPDNELIPVKGIYASAVQVDKTRYPAATYIGTRPTFEGDKLVIETHLIDFQGSLYGQTISVDFFKKMREDIKFDSVEALKAQITKDVKQIREYFSRHADDQLIQPINWPE
ncbi:MAG TPA: bifunctional riboflavin kinase/FAD synthetase [Acidobacteriota bacterium]|nr:bifunctional riboflavin kinase/FAD synthetase [Acidobacteriota bacterium]